MAKTYIEVATQSDLTEVTETVTTLSETVDTLTTSVDGTDDTDGLVNEVSDLEDRVTELEDEASSSITVTAIYDANTSLSTISDDGYYIWTSDPADLSTYLSTGTVNDIWECSSSVWSTYLAYDSCAATIAISANSDGEITYMKSEGSWVEVGTGSSTTVEITAMYDDNTNVATVTTEGYYIWTALPSDSDTIDSYAVNDIAYYDGVNWSVYSTYAISPTTIYNLDTATSYEKLDGAWTETVTALNEIKTNLSRLTAYYDSSTSYSVTNDLFHWTTYDTSLNDGDDPITYSTSSYTFTLPAGYGYNIETLPIGRSAYADYCVFYIYDNTDDTEIGTNGQYHGVGTSTSVQINNRTAKALLDLRDSSESHVITVTMGEQSGDPYQVYSLSNGDAKGYIIIEQLTSASISFIASDSIEVTNNSSATENQLLISNGDETASFVDANDAGVVPYTTTPVSSATLTDYTTTGNYAVQYYASSDFPDNMPSSADYCILTVKEYSSTNGLQILRSADYDATTTELFEYYRAWENSNWTNWFTVPQIQETTDLPDSGSMLVATGTNNNYEPIKFSVLSLYKTSNTKFSTIGSQVTKIVGWAEGFSYDGTDPITWSSSYSRVSLPAGYVYEVTLHGGFITGYELNLAVFPYSSTSYSGLYVGSACNLSDVTGGTYGTCGSSTCYIDTTSSSSATLIKVCVRYVRSGASTIYGWTSSTADRCATELVVRQISK